MIYKNFLSIVHLAILEIPWAVALERACGVVPVAHEESDDLMSLLFE